jgi:hypothetical protein
LSDEVVISQEAVDELMRDIDGPVGDLMRDIAHQIEVVAVAHAPILKARNVRSLKSTAFRSGDGTIKTPGYLKRHITSTVGHAISRDGLLFGGAESPGDPGIFLEAPAEQMHEKHPFLTTGLWSVSLD